MKFTGNNIMQDLGGYLTPEQIKRIINHCEQEEHKLLIHMLFNTGRRITEVIGRKEYIHNNNNKDMHKVYAAVPGLKPKDINWEDRTITWNILKKGRPTRRVKPVSVSTINWLRSFVTRHEIEPDSNIFNLTRFKAFYYIRKAAIAAGINAIGDKAKGVHPHHFRHSYAVRMAKESRIPGALKILQEQLDHSDINMTAVYLQFNVEDARKAVDEVFD